MTERNERQPVDVLDLATIALRDTSIPDGPPSQLTASTVEALQSARFPPDVVRLHERKQKMFRLFRYSSAAAAVALVAILGSWLFLMDRTASLAFADVVENVKNAKSVTFVIKTPTVIRGTKKGILQQKVYIQGDAYRMEIPSARWLPGGAGRAAPRDGIRGGLETEERDAVRLHHENRQEN